MPQKSKTSNNAKKSRSSKKLPGFFGNRRTGLTVVVVLVVAAIGGTYMMQRSQALGQVCSRTSTSCAPTTLECGALKPRLTEGMYRNGCVAAVQAFYNKGFGLNFVQIDGIYGPTTRNVTALYEGTKIASNPIPHRFIDGKDINDAIWHKIVLDCYKSGRAASYCTTHYTYR
jgi:hypothetical protein